MGGCHIHSESTENLLVHKRRTLVKRDSSLCVCCHMEEKLKPLADSLKPLILCLKPAVGSGFGGSGLTIGVRSEASHNSTTPGFERGGTGGVPSPQGSGRTHLMSTGCEHGGRWFAGCFPRMM